MDYDVLLDSLQQSLLSYRYQEVAIISYRGIEGEPAELYNIREFDIIGEGRLWLIYLLCRNMPHI